MEKINIRRVSTGKSGKNKAKTHIEYEHICLFCSTKYWAKKINGLYCSKACIALSRRERTSIIS